jgi:hypothetical protein
MKIWILIGTWHCTLRIPDPTVFLRELFSSPSLLRKSSIQEPRNRF